MSWGSAPEPKTPLGRRRILSPICGLRVSPLQLGAMSLGDAWSQMMGSMNKEKSFELLDAFVEAGGNFIDTANNYQEGQSETWIGEWMKARGNRDELVIATKFTTGFRNDRPDKSNYCGNHAKSLHVSLEQSLQKLQTTYVDILYLHWWEYTTSIEEVMQSLNNFVRSGKVLYLGISDTPAWVVSSANRYARDHGLAQFVIYQGKWNVAERDFERDILDMVLHEGMALAPWNVLGGGKWQTKAALEERKKAGEGIRSMMYEGQSERDSNVSAALEKVAGELGVTSLTAVALAYVLEKRPYVFPIIGGRKREHLEDNITALSVKLDKEQIAYLESIVPFSPGFPKDVFGGNPAIDQKPNFLMGAIAQYDFVGIPQAIGRKDA